MRRLVLVLCFVFGIGLVGAVTNITECGALDTNNTIYNLNQSIGAGAGTDCIQINATNVTLDCQGYNITYGNATAGWGVFVANEGGDGSFDNVTVKNCVIIQNSTGVGDSAIFFGEFSNNSVAYNNTITVSGLETVGILFEGDSVNANISLNNITTSGINGTGVFVEMGGSSSDISNNVVVTSGNDSSGIKMGDNSSGLVFNNTVTVFGGLSTMDGMGGIFLEVGTSDINVSSNTITISGYNSVGVWVWSCSNHTVDNNIITTTGGQGDGIYVVDIQAGGINITSNTINVSGIAADGIHSQESESSPNLFYNNVITTSANYSYGIFFWEDGSNNISSNNITTSGNLSYGIFINESQNSTITNNIIKTGTTNSYVLYFITSSNQSVYNNIFNTSTSGSGVYINNSDLNYFNTTNTTLTNIIGRAYVCGNFWTNVNGNGYSDRCVNLDGDYFCDSAYVIIGGESHTDYLPLTNGDSWVSSCASLNVENKSYYLNQSITINGTCFNITANGITLDFEGFNITGNTTEYGVNITGYNDTTIRDGFIYNFSNGIYLENNINNNITNITSNNNSLYGIVLSTSSNNTMITITVNNNSHGINLANSDNNIFTSVIANLNTLLGLYLNVSSTNTFTNFNISDSGISLDNATSNTFTHFDINDSLADAVTLANEASDNNFADVVMGNTSSSHYDINFSTAGIDGIWIENIEFTNYSFAGAGGKVNFKEPGFGEIVFLEAINGSGNSLKSDVDIENNSVFVDSSSNSGLNKSANISFYSVSFTDPKPQYSSDGVTYADCTASTNPACAEFAYTVGGTFKFNVSHFTYFKIVEGYSAPADEEEDTTTSTGGGPPLYVPSVSQLSEGYKKELYETWRVSFRVDNVLHVFTVKEITDETARITISSETQEATLLIGEEKSFDVSGDGYYDLLVKLNSVDDGIFSRSKANFTIQTIHEEIVAQVSDDSEVDGDVIQDGGLDSTGDEGVEENSLVWLWVLVVVVLILSGVGYKWFRK